MLLVFVQYAFIISKICFNYFGIVLFRLIKWDCLMNMLTMVLVTVAHSSFGSIGFVININNKSYNSTGNNCIVMYTIIEYYTSVLSSKTSPDSLLLEWRPLGPPELKTCAFLSRISLIIIFLHFSSISSTSPPFHQSWHQVGLGLHHPRLCSQQRHHLE